MVDDPRSGPQFTAEPLREALAFGVARETKRNIAMILIPRESRYGDYDTLGGQPLGHGVDRLLCLGDRECDRRFAGRMHFGPDEAVFFNHATDLLRDDATRLVLPHPAVRRRSDVIAAVFNRLFVSGTNSRADKSAPERPEYRGHGWTPKPNSPRH